jgi:hypothetical protein
MLRGVSTMNLWAEDLPADPLVHRTVGVDPYLIAEVGGRGSGFVEFRIGDYQHKLGIIDRRFAPPDLAAGRSHGRVP